MLYYAHEALRTLIAPFVHYAEANARWLTSPRNPFARWPGMERLAAGFELLHRIGKDYEKPEFGIRQITAHGHTVPVVECVVAERPFCRLLRFKRFSDDPDTIKDLKDDPPVLLVAPLSGHHATLLRDTVRTLLPEHKVYITDWVDARMVPLAEGPFHLHDYVRYVEAFIRLIGAERLHVISVCQPTVPVLAAVSLMAARGEPIPRSLILMGGPIDARRSPTKVNDLARTRPLAWFEANLIHTVPERYPGHGRKVYPGFLQHAGFVAMNPSRHFRSHWDFYEHLIRGDLEDAEAHRRFYDEYNAVLDLPAEYYLDTVRVVFQEYLLPRGEWWIGDERVDPAAIRDTALLTIEGQLDDISGLGQSEAAHGLCRNVPKARSAHLTVEGAGHYGIFSGRRWREQVYPVVRDFIRQAIARS
ncbi:MAG: PHB depolymerase [Lysobacterales bacterium]|jgi:poly(3-hydroxybutyrate) depolymerase|nr:MAG: PHB depolymerase [Xanthomonadales bacterium]